MSARTVRFVHRPIPDETKENGEGQRGAPIRKPLIDPDGIRPIVTSDSRKSGWLGGAFSKLLRVWSRERK